MNFLKTTPILLLFSCTTTTESIDVPKGKTPKVVEEKDSIPMLTQAEIGLDSIDIYFENPVDFYALKKKTTHMHSGGNFLLKDSFFHSVQDKKYVYYSYWAIGLEKELKNDRSVSFMVLKPWTEGTKERYYETDNEILIGIKSKIAWEGFEDSDFVGQNLNEIETQFGPPHFEKEGCWVYHKHDKILVLKMDQEQVKWFKYIWMQQKIENIEDLPAQLFQWSKKA